MLSLASFGDRAALVAEALSCIRSPHVRHGVDVLDSTDTPTGETLRFEWWSVRWSYRAADRVVGQSDQVAVVRRVASLRMPAGHGLNLNARRLRLWSEWLLLDGTWARFPLGVFLVVNPGAVSDDGMQVTLDLTLADKTHLWANTFLTEPLHLTGAEQGVPWVRDRLESRFGETSFALPTSSATIGEPRTFEVGTSELEVCSQVLEAVAHDQLTTTPDGAATTVPLSTIAGRGAEATYGAGQGKVLEAGQVEPLLPTLPNVVRFSARQGPSLGNVEGNGLRTVKNQSTGPASIDARGFEVELRVDTVADSQSVLDDIAAADAQRYFAGGGLRWSGQVALNPRAGDRDVIALELPRLGAAGVWQVTEWTYVGRPIQGAQDVLMPIVAEQRVTV